VAWSTLPSDIEPPSSQEFGLPGIHGRGGRGRDRERGGRGGSEKGRGRGNGAVPQSNKEYPSAPSSPNLFCYNCNKSDHHTMKCPLSLTLEAREKIREHGKGRGRGGGEMGNRYKKKERDFAGLALDVLSHVFLDPITNLGDFTVSNTPSLPFINPLLFFASCDDLEAEEGSSMSAVEPHGNTHRDDSPCAVLCPTHQGITLEKMTSKYAHFVKFQGEKAMPNELNAEAERTKMTEQPLQRFTSNAAIANFFPRSHGEKLTNFSNLIFDKLTNISSNVKLNMSDGCQMKGRGRENNYFIPLPLLPPSGKGKIIGNFSTFIQNGNLSIKIANFANQIYCAQAKVLHYQHVSAATQRARLS
jgi:hypothetical protein